MQVQMFEAIAQNNPAILLKAPTGSGKLEAILFPALAENYRIFLPLPARSLLKDQKQRIENYLKLFSKLHPGPEVSLVVDTGSQMRRLVYRDGNEIHLGINPRPHLYKGNVILTTLDKFLYHYFGEHPIFVKSWGCRNLVSLRNLVSVCLQAKTGCSRYFVFGDSQKSFIFPLWIHL